jgi:hypothetical protein
VLSVLVLSPPDPEVEALAASHPSIEVLQAHDAGDAIEKLGRNRRIDAVLVAGWTGAAASGFVAEIHEDNPAPPPVFVVGGVVPGARPLPFGALAAALDALERELTADG